MKIRSIVINNLQKRKNISIKFNDDINIITGANGSGKTTVIKLIWYLVSGNLERIFREVEFDSLILKTTRYDLNINVTSDLIIIITKIAGKFKEYHFSKSSQQNINDLDEFDVNDEGIGEIDDLNRILVPLTPGSVFFPTFRRVEGGFSLTEMDNSDGYKRRRDPTSKLQTGLVDLSTTLSVYNNLFISSISTHDITDLLRKKHSESSEKVNSLHIAMSEYIEKRIESINANTSADSKDSILKDIQKMVISVKSKREDLLSSFTTLSSLISEIFKHTGIKFTDKVSVGDTEKAISSAKMSAGEQQLLSFICYNAFYQDVPFIIDEPELSLHIDWQRNLLPILKSQKNGNQIIIATHSPFIYSKFPEKEIIIND